jgi:L-rhamnose mutarotase
MTERQLLQTDFLIGKINQEDSMKKLLLPLLAILITLSCCSNKSPCEKAKRYCLTLDLKDDPDLIKEYQYWHDSKNIWPEIPRGIRKVGILDMEIYLLDNRLFMIIETPEDFDFDQQMAKLAQLPRQAEWEAFVSKFQKSSADAKSSEKWRRMDRIFKLP